MSIEAGTISHGTHRECDLIPAFLGVLDAEAPERAKRIRDEHGQSFIDRCCGPHGLDYSLVYEMDRQAWLVSDLFDALDAIAPEGHYFGAIEGDGTDFGFWEVDEHSLNEAWGV